MRHVKGSGSAAREPSLPGFEERFTDAKAVRIRYFIGGKGPPVVLVHGLSGAASNWAEMAPRLAQQRCVIVPELPGHGGSAPLPAAPNIDAYAERVRLVAAREGMLPAAFVGHSLGGLVALRLALRRPGDVTAVALIAPAGIASATRWSQFWIEVLGFARPSRVVARFRGAVARSPLLRSVVFTPWQVGDARALPAVAVEGFLGTTPLHTDVISAGRALVHEDPRLDLDGVRTRCLVVWGARDRQVPVDDGFEYARRLGARLRVVVAAGHLLIGERPDACVDAVEAFLAEERASPDVARAGGSPAGWH